ncbi:type I-C CRISPR-associated protein Cas8c/Csd1 [Clostridium vitabionis]|uniref:type I-C CRISPR-associated protein Cas8c/Csd1 n=1 Tax=Clostridium vitabionis TaxID=2784388 RepID=UPI00188ACF95|nr:type I-C CRISPR-associated protein Cas8c/Csd1 [Clostridium vitabionis]
MLISALNDYYNVLIARNMITDSGYADTDISYQIILSPEGKLVGLQDCRNSETVENAKGKSVTRIFPKKMSIPERPRSTTVSANYVEVRPGYIFGLEYHPGKNGDEDMLSTESNGTTAKQKGKLNLQHQSFCQEVRQDFGDMTSPIAMAYVRFAETWQPAQETKNPYLMGIKADLNKCKFVFCLEGHPEMCLQEEDQVRQKWGKMRETEDSGMADQVICQCAVTGEKLPVAEVHDAMIAGRGIGIRNAGINPSLVNFKPESFLSYGHEQGENACISVRAMKRYTKALNFLLVSPSNHSYIDGQTIVYWSSDGNSDNDILCKTIFDQPSDQYSAEELDSALRGLIGSANAGTVTDTKLADVQRRITADTDFYILCLAPNASRIQVKYLVRKKFGKLLENIARFQQELQIFSRQRPVALSAVKQELVSPSSTHPEDDDTSFDTLFRAVIEGTPYPVWCLQRMITRMKKDSEQQLSYRSRYIRPGFIKACLIRNAKEKISMAYDGNNTNPAYVCGALFAVLQKIQEDSLRQGSTKAVPLEDNGTGLDHEKPERLNRTIKDAYFSMAVSNPAAVMPKLIKLSTHHMKKLQREHPGWAANDEKILTETLDKLSGEFPGTLNLYDQGRFILGYSHRYSAFFKKNNNNE